MNTAEAMAVMRAIEPLWREGMSVEEFEAETREVAEWDRRMDAWRAAGNRPKSELPIDHAQARRLKMDRLRAKRYRKNKKKKVTPNVTVCTPY